jgi:hypothetical protein
MRWRRWVRRSGNFTANELLARHKFLLVKL